MSNKLTPLEAPFPPNIDAILSKYPQQDGYLLALFRTFANSERFLTKGVPSLLDADSPLDIRAREIVILRVTANKNCEYEWGLHAKFFARAAELTDEQVAATRKGGTECWPEKEQTLIAAIDQLCDGGVIDDQTLASFENDWSKEQQLEIIALCGAYSTVSFVANTARLKPEPFAARFPE